MHLFGSAIKESFRGTVLPRKSNDYQSRKDNHEFKPMSNSDSSYMFPGDVGSNNKIQSTQQYNPGPQVGPDYNKQHRYSHPNFIQTPSGSQGSMYNYANSAIPSGTNLSHDNNLQWQQYVAQPLNGNHAQNFPNTLRSHTSVGPATCNYQSNMQYLPDDPYRMNGTQRGQSIHAPNHSNDTGNIGNSHYNGAQRGQSFHAPNPSNNTGNLGNSSYGAPWGYPTQGLPYTCNVPIQYQY